MTPTEITAIGGVIVAIFASVIVPLIIVRRGEVRAAMEANAKTATDNAKLAADVATNRELNWENINAALVKERDRLQHVLNETAAKYADEARSLRERLDQEASDIRSRYDRELSRANDRIEACQNEVDRLRRRLYDIPTPQAPQHRSWSSDPLTGPSTGVIPSSDE